MRNYYQCDCFHFFFSWSIGLPLRYLGYLMRHSILFSLQPLSNDTGVIRYVKKKILALLVK